MYKFIATITIALDGRDFEYDEYDRLISPAKIAEVRTIVIPAVVDYYTAYSRAMREVTEYIRKHYQAENVRYNLMIAN